MWLTGLELSGFKSFAKRTKLEFEPGVTAVVGPNGSGKSNIADAVRWVLGAQSKKAVRGKVASDVIFSGTSGRAAMGLAEVSLTFDNHDKKLPYEYDEVVVTRRLYRSGESEYAVNGSRVRLADLQHALAVAGVGAENYTVISQGMVDRALTQSPRERRSLFEEAAGVRQFYLRRDETLRKLTETSTNLSRVEDILAELQPRVKTLDRQASALAKRQELETRLATAQLAWFGHRYRDLQTGFRQQQGRRSEVDQEFMALTKELSNVSANLTEERERQQGLKLNKLLQQRDVWRTGRETFQQQLNEAITAREVATAQLTQLNTSREQSEGRLRDLRDLAPPEVRASTADDTAEITVLEKQYAQLTERYQALQQSLKPTPHSGGWPSWQRDFQAALKALEQAVSAGATPAKLKPHLQKLRQLGEAAGTLSGQTKPADLQETAKLITERDRVTKELHAKRLTQAATQEAQRQQQLGRQRHEQETTALEQQLAQLATQRTAAEQAVVSHTATITDTNTQIAKLTRQYQSLDREIATEQQQSLVDTKKLTELESTLQTKQRTHEAYRSELGTINVELAKLETRLDELAREAKVHLPSWPPADEQELPPLEPQHEQLLTRLTRQLAELGGIEPGVAAEHAETKERFEFLTAQADDLRQAKADLEQVIKQLERQSQTLFRESFQSINAAFTEYFTRLFGGGTAGLVLLDETDEETGETHFGVDINATPPGKRLKNLAMLSGGERAMTSVALLFAILKVNPSPFVMLDEVDAALDEANTSRFADVLGELADTTQFVVVTHNRDTMKAARTLYGVTMDDSGVSTMLTLKLPEAEKLPERSVAAHT